MAIFPEKTEPLSRMLGRAARDDLGYAGGWSPEAEAELESGGTGAVRFHMFGSILPIVHSGTRAVLK